VASRRASEQLILAGRVSVNGTRIDELGTRVDPDQDRVSVDGKPVQVASARWLMLNKPMGYITTASDPQGRPKVVDLLPPGSESLRHVGRLDFATEGLLILTNQGDVAERLLHPRYQVEREYRVWVAEKPAPATLSRLTTGVELEDGLARATRISLEGRPDRDGVPMRLVVTEGRNREVRRLLEAVGHPVRRLRRVRFGPVRLGSLARGQWRELTDEEVRALEAPGTKP